MRCEVFRSQLQNISILNHPKQYSNNTFREQNFILKLEAAGPRGRAAAALERRHGVCGPGKPGQGQYECGLCNASGGQK